MTDINSFTVNGNIVKFELDGEEFEVKYPDQYEFGRYHNDFLKDIALCAWANKLAFTKSAHSSICFDTDDEQIGFWLWVAQYVHKLDVYQSDDDTQPVDFRDIAISTGKDTSTLIPVEAPDINLDGALVCQSPGKESIASKLILEENGIEPVYSMFYEYPSRAATHKIQGREEFEDYYDNPTIRVWSDTNSLQSTLRELTENYEPITCFWEMMYAAISVPLMIEHELEYLLMGNQLNTGEAMPTEEYVAFEELNQSYIFEIAYSEYLNTVRALPVTHTSNVRPFTGYSCRKIIARHDPGWLPHMQNCIKPKPANRWCNTCYKCGNSWVEFLACGMDPVEAGLSHDVLIENQWLGGDGEAWNFSFPRFERDEHVWKYEGARQFFENEVAETLNDEQWDAFETWRSRQMERVDDDDVNQMHRYNGKFIKPCTVVIPDETVNDMGLPMTDYVPEALDPSLWAAFAGEWHTFYGQDEGND